jgi:hypothetical protein
MITHHFADVFEPGDPRVADLEHRVFEFSSFLVDVLGVEDVGAKLDGSRRITIAATRYASLRSKTRRGGCSRMFRA